MPPKNQLTLIVDFEVSLLRLFESVTNGTVIEISYTGTTIAFRPGFIAGSTSTIIDSHKHECPLSRPIGYFLEPLLLLAAFGKAPTNVMLSGITSGSDPGHSPPVRRRRAAGRARPTSGITSGNDSDPSVDLLRVGLLPVLKRFGIEDYELRVPFQSFSVR